MKSVLGLFVILSLATELLGGVTTVNQSSFSFAPANITIEEGDTVKWVWSSGLHTVTSGTNPSDTEAGSLFDAPLSLSNPTFSYVFENAGVFPYHCIPHWSSYNMIGEVTVTQAAVQDTAPAAPEGLMVEAGNGEVTLTWRQSTATDFALYRVYGDTMTSPAKLVDSTSSATDTTVTLTGLTNGITYYSHVTAVDSGGNESNISNEVSATPEGTVKIAADAGGLPQGFVLEQNFPNPFNPVTTLRYTLPIATRVRLAVYTLEGREVVLLMDDWQPAGTHQLQWDGADRWGQTVGSGVYLVRLESGKAAATRRVLLLK